MDDKATWTDERVTALRALIEQGMTSYQIAKALGGVSRNAVIGKVLRLKLIRPPVKREGSKPQSSGGDAAALANKLRRKAAGLTAEPQPKLRMGGPVFDPAPVVERPRPANLVSFRDLADNGCRMSWGDPQTGDFRPLTPAKTGVDFGFCGAPQLPGSAWCPECNAVCNVGVKPIIRKTHVGEAVTRVLEDA